MTSDHSGTDSTFTAAVVLTAYADMKMGLSNLTSVNSKQVRSSWVNCSGFPQPSHTD